MHGSSNHTSNFQLLKLSFEREPLNIYQKQKPPQPTTLKPGSQLIILLFHMDLYTPSRSILELPDSLPGTKASEGDYLSKDILNDQCWYGELVRNRKPKTPIFHEIKRQP
ncbi:predicted protein [Histoplasma capsulatum G186AR]|uniref:Uncharacterized protein n=2 Tax=Ajellomyces capsulatus TaxID=5037 RepID=C0NEH6_AJECG|nr:uncharacterized protein HCBG_01292 [Histoplasma capsulatum G186AR]EEH09647.1 predicted protein [Histoplasma capsulatum G186AR]